MIIKRFILFFFVFISIYVVTIIVIGEILEGKPYQGNIQYKRVNGFMQTRLNDIKNYKNVDILVLGSSHAYKQVDPRIYEAAGYSIFNLGSSLQTPEVSDFLLNRYIVALNPKMVLYSVNPDLFSNEQIWSLMDLISNTEKLDSLLIKKALLSFDFRIINVLVYSAYRQLFHKKNSTSEPKRIGFDTYIKAGFVECDYGVFQPVTDAYFSDVQFKYSLKQIRSFQKTIRFLHEKNLPVLVFQSPAPQKVLDSYTNLGELNKIIEQLHVEYLDFNKGYHFPDSLFYDNTHLNQNGIKKMNHELILHISEKQYLVCEN